MWLNGSHQREKQWRVRFWMNYRIIAEGFDVVWCSTGWNTEGKRMKSGRVQGQILSSLVGKLDLGYILWQLYCLAKLKIRFFFLVASVLLSYHPTWFAFLPLSSWSNNLSQKSKYSSKEERSENLSSQWQWVTALPWYHGNTRNSSQ